MEQPFFLLVTCRQWISKIDEQEGPARVMHHLGGSTTTTTNNKQQTTNNKQQPTTNNQPPRADGLFTRGRRGLSSLLRQKFG
jgi:hypothetical protein